MKQNVWRLVEVKTGKDTQSVPYLNKADSKDIRNALNSQAGWDAEKGTMPFQIRRGSDHWKGKS